MTRGQRYGGWTAGREQPARKPAVLYLPVGGRTFIGHVAARMKVE